MRLIAGSIIGLTIALAIIFVVESVIGLIMPFAAGIGGEPNSSGSSIRDSLPLGPQICDIIALTLGIFGGGLIGGLVAGRRAIISWLVAPFVLLPAALSYFSFPYDEGLIRWALGSMLFAAALASWYARRRPNFE
ncbi:MAG: hypothetical protein AAF950_14955 [Pseudomonadota bacterium]